MPAEPKPPEALDDYLSERILKTICAPGQDVKGVGHCAEMVERYKRWVAELAKLQEDAERWRKGSRDGEAACEAYDELRKVVDRTARELSRSSAGTWSKLIGALGEPKG